MAASIPASVVGAVIRPAAPTRAAAPCAPAAGRAGPRRRAPAPRPAPCPGPRPRAPRRRGGSPRGAPPPPRGRPRPRPASPGARSRRLGRLLAQAGSARDELDTGFLERALELLHRIELGTDRAAHSFDTFDGTDRDTGGLGELLLLPSQHRTRCPELVSHQQGHCR